MFTKEPKQQAGFVTIIGMPNAGKSTLVNLLFSQKLAIVSPKAQTTRYALKTIYNEDNLQIVFIDTPGIIIKKSYLMHQKMMQQLSKATESADILIIIVDGHKFHPNIIETLKPWVDLGKKHITLLNKVDRITKKKAEEKIALLQKAEFKNIMPFTATKDIEKTTIINALKPLLPESPAYYDDKERLSDRNLKFFCAELIREQLYYHLDNELPYETATMIHEFIEKENVTVIYADIIVSKKSQKIILVGKGGTMIQDIGTKARQSIETFLGAKVYLQLHVKVREQWRKKIHYLNEYGFAIP